MTPGYIYAIRRPDTGEVKIGLSVQPWHRLRALQTAHGQSLVPALILQSADMVRDEAEIHKAFAHLRLQGEWFTEGPEIRMWIEVNQAISLSLESFRPPPSPPRDRTPHVLRPREQCEFETAGGRRCLNGTRVRMKNPATGEVKLACGAHEFTAAAGWDRMVGSEP